MNTYNKHLSKLISGSMVAIF